MFRARLSVSARFMLVLGIGLVFQAGISAVSLFHLRKTLIDARTAEVKHLLETAYSTVDFYHEQSVKGLLTDAQARQAAIDAVRAMRYGDNNYYFIWAMDGTGVAHGSHPEWEGHNVLQSPYKERWPVTSYMVARLIEVCKTPQKEGVAHYKIPKKGGTVPLDKIAYTRLFEPWGWSIGTGAYVDDIDATFRAQAVIILAIFAGLIGLASLVSFILARDLARALVRLSRCVARVAKGDFEGDVPGIDRRDEVGLMARALLVFRDNSREVLELRLDQLTGLPNRKLLMDRIKQSMNSSTRNGSYCGIMLIDMDKFKALNDSQGHDIGDMLLHEVARRLSVCIRPGDIVARLGGDEFVALLVDLGAREDEAASVIETLAERILHALSQTYHFGHIHHDTSASIGIALFKGQACAAEELLKQADLAMYKAKQMGRNASRFFDPLMEAAVHERATLEADLRLALFKNQFELYYQPLIGKGDVPTGAEALIRWNHPSRGLVQPDSFIPLVEENGLILPIGEWVLRTACQQLAAWALDPETAALKLSVNVSTRQFQSPAFVEKLLALLQSSSANPRLLILELTESLLVEDVEEVVARMVVLQRHGISFSLDDFGTGYSSLSYLKLMPLNQLKIDRSFVRDLLTDPNDEAIARTIITLADALGLNVLAEGVETIEQRTFLEEAGCHAFQGYLFSRPLPIAAFHAFLQSQANLAADR